MLGWSPKPGLLSQLAAQALGCSVAEIAKCIVFTGRRTIVVVPSGDKRVDTAKLKLFFGTDLRFASADEVKTVTNYLIGGVPPFPHPEGLSVYADSSLRRFSKVWAAAGEPSAVMNVAVDDLVKAIDTEFIDVAAD